MKFSSILLLWYSENKRELPWRDIDNPYVIWIAEVVFQQTRIEQGLPFFIKFIERFDSVQSLGAASEVEVLKLWQGLGYYSRARNLHYSAKYILNELNGVFPNTYNDLLKLKGVGPYIAAEIASVCYGFPIAAIDGNVQRVISRYFGIKEAVNSTIGMRMITEIANEHMDTKSPGDFNQALMDFGSSICSPKAPSCEMCVFADSCYANRHHLQSELPLKIRKVKVSKRFFNYLLIVHNGKLAMQKRGAGDVWQGLFQPILQESKNEIVNSSNLEGNTKGFVLMEHKRQLSHQSLYLKFWSVSHTDVLENSVDMDWVPLAEISDLPVPKSVEQLFSSSEFRNTYLSNDY